MAFSMMGAMGDYMAEKTREIVKIDLANIADDENNDFEVMGGTEIEKKNALLKASIEQFGLLDPLIVRPAGSGMYTLISGHRRKLMHERLAAEGKEEFRKVDCVIIDADETDAEQMLLEANLPNRVISDWEKMQAVKRMNEIFKRREDAGEKIKGRRREHIAEALGMSLSAVGRLEKIEKSLTDEYKQEYKDGNISTGVADKLASKSEEEQKAIHATKGAKVKLADLQNDKPLPKETKTRLQDIPESAGELFIIIGQYDGRYYAGYCGQAIESDGHIYAFENIDKDQKYVSYKAAWDGALEMITQDAWGNDLLKMKAQQTPANTLDISDDQNEPQETIQDDTEPDTSKLAEARGYELAAYTLEKARAELYEQQSDAWDNGGDDETINALQIALNCINKLIMQTRQLEQKIRETVS